MIVRLTAEAEADLEAIGDFIARDNPRRALNFLLELKARCLDLGETPLAFPLLPRHAAEGVRRRVYGAYLIFYRVGEGGVDVLHVLHGAQDYDDVL